MSSGLPAGKQLASMMFQNLSMGQLPYATAFTLSVTKEQNQAYYAVPKISKSTKLTDEELAIANHWAAQLRVKNVIEVVDNDDVL